jgi:hypothetical protein
MLMFVVKSIVIQMKGQNRDLWIKESGLGVKFDDDNIIINSILAYNMQTIKMCLFLELLGQ